jgi:molybdopterin biosynthesis enzyme
VRRSEKKQPTLFCALSGNPWSARLVFEEILVPCLWRRQGLGRLSIPVVTAVLKGAIKKRKGTYRAVPGKLYLEDHPPTFTPSDKGKGSLFSTLKNDLAYVLVDAEVERVPWESPVQVRLHDCPLQSLPSYGLLPELKEEDPQC